jgi:5-methylcytosine-specific restriction endonuclease McrA
MPRTAPRLCSRPGCPGLVQDGRCTICGLTPTSGWDGRGTKQQRGYGSDWEKVRQAAIDKALVEQGGVIRCEACGLPISGTIHADHRKPFSGLDDPLRLDVSNVRLLHPRCHMQRTARQKKR